MGSQSVLNEWRNLTNRLKKTHSEPLKPLGSLLRRRQQLEQEGTGVLQQLLNQRFRLVRGDADVAAKG